MANNIRIISGCTQIGQAAADFGSLPVIGNNVYYLTFAGDFEPGCYTVGSITATTNYDTVLSADQYANSCPDCLAGNPTPTTTPTPTVTPTVTTTVTPTKTPTKTPTPTVTPTVTTTVTPTKTPTSTPTKTPTPSVTSTVTPTKTPTPTKTVTPTVSPTVTPTSTMTPTPSFTPFFSISAGTDYTVCVVCPEDGLTGFTYTSTEVPHPAAANAQENMTIYQMGAIVIGGPNGLNN